MKAAPQVSEKLLLTLPFLPTLSPPGLTVEPPRGASRDAMVSSLRRHTLIGQRGERESSEMRRLLDP